MSMRDEDFGVTLALAEAGDGSGFPATEVPASPDWESLYRQAEVRSEELRRAELASRCRANSLEARLGKARRKLEASAEELKAVRCAAKDALFHRSEAARLEKLLFQAGVESGKDCTMMSLRKEAFRLREALKAEKARNGAPPPESRGKAVPSGAAPMPRSPGDIAGRRQAREIVRLRKALDRSRGELQAKKGTIRELRAELRGSRKEEAQLHKRIDGFGDQLSVVEFTALVKSLRAENAALEKRAKAAERHCKWLDRENKDLGWSNRKSLEYREELEARHREETAWLREEIARERSYRGREWRRRKEAVDAAVGHMDKQLAQLRKALVRAKETIESMRGRNARSRAAERKWRTEAREWQVLMKAMDSRIEALESQVAKLRSTRAVLSKATFGKKSERQDRPGTGRNRGQQPGSAGHGRTPRPGLREQEERRDPPEDARTCSCCGEPYFANGEHATSVIEIEVKAHVRRIVRQRWRRGCGCASSPLEVIAPPEPRLFHGTSYGTSVWARFLFELCASLRPLCQVAAWLADQGLPVSPGTLADSLKRFLPLFEPLAAAILAHQNRAAVRHIDETGWRVQEFRKDGRSPRGWLWVSVSRDSVCFHVSASRSARAARVLFTDGSKAAVVVCDRFSTYKRLARDLEGKVVLQWCWAHQRRNWINAAAGHPRFTRWCGEWIGRVAEIYRLNDARLKHYDPVSGRRTPGFQAAQAELEDAVARLFADAEAELAGLPEKARKAKPLRSLLKHREGLCVFVGRPDVPMDNNAAERALREPVIWRKLTFGSNSRDGAKFMAVMRSVIGTLSMNGIDLLKWLEAWLKACAENGGKPPEDLSSWLPWSMSAERQQRFIAPG